MKFTTQWHFGNNVCELTPLKIEDQRGFFSEVYQKNDFEKLGIMENFMQENHSFTSINIHLEAYICKNLLSSKLN